MADQITQAVVDAARLYGELEKKAIDNILAQIVPKENNLVKFNGALVLVPRALSSATFEQYAVWKVSFKLNNIEITLQENVPLTGVYTPGRAKEIAEKITTSIMEKVRNEIYHAFMPAFIKEMPELK